jgi:hypothetical protein
MGEDSMTTDKKDFLDKLLPVTKHPYLLVTKIWGFEPNALTPKGISDVMIDLMTLLASTMLIVYFPNDIMPEPILQWIGVVVLLGVIVFVMLPSMSRILFGSYEHYIRKCGSP